MQKVGPQWFAVVAIDCGKAGSTWMMCDFCARVLVPPTEVENARMQMQLATVQVEEACRKHDIRDTIVVIEMTGTYHRPIQRAFRKAGFETRPVHPFASKHYRLPAHGDNKTDDNDLEGIFRAGLFPSHYQSAEVDRVDSRDIRCRIVNRVVRPVFQMVSGGKRYRHPSRLDRGYVLGKLLAFHREHRTPPHEIVADLKQAARQIPKPGHLEEAAPLRTVYERCRSSRRAGPQAIGTLLVAVLARLGVRESESEVEAQGSLANVSDTAAWGSLSLVFTRLVRNAHEHQQRLLVLDASRYREPLEKIAPRRLSYRYALTYNS